MKKKYMFCLLLVCFILTSCGQNKKTTDWKLVWSDEFDGEELDLTKWSCQTGNSYNGWGNYEAQFYQSENVSVKDGILTICARREEKDGCEFTSGRIRTMTDEGESLFHTQYGKIEARIAVDSGNGLWPAFWMMPAGNEYGLWPLSGEIDIMEARGRIADTVNGTINYGEKIPNNKFSNGEYTFTKGEDITGYHIYAVEWDTDEIKWTVDGKEFYKTSNWYSKDENGNMQDYPAPFNKPFYLILNMAVGGTYDEGVMPDESMQKAEMKVDYVRVYENKKGYSKVSEDKKNNEKDKESFEMSDNYISDTNFDTVNMTAFKKTPEYEKNKWFFVTKEYFAGSADGEIMSLDGEVFFECKIVNPGEKRYSIQLQHEVALVKGYTYSVEFDAKADDNRFIAFQPIGLKDKDTVSYGKTQEFSLTNSMQHYYCSFTMKDETDLYAILEFNFGLEKPDVTFGNVKITCIS